MEDDSPQSHVHPLTMRASPTMLMALTAAATRCFLSQNVSFPHHVSPQSHGVYALDRRIELEKVYVVVTSLSGGHMQYIWLLYDDVGRVVYLCKNTIYL
jgi:hypothetical protein